MEVTPIKSRSLVEEFCERLVAFVREAIKRLEIQGLLEVRQGSGVRFREIELGWRTIEPDLITWAKQIENKEPRLKEGDLPIAARWPPSATPFASGLSPR